MTTSAKSLPQPRKIVTYPISEEPNGGAVFLYGNLDASTIAVFCAGFPDDHENGQIFCSRLSKESDTLVGLMCLPGYDDRPDKPWQSHRKGGYTFQEMSNCIRETVKVLRKESSKDRKEVKLIGIFHDWGVMPGTVWANQTLEGDDINDDSPDELIIFDVLTSVHKDQKNDVPEHIKQPLKEKFITWTYQLIFASSFAVYNYISKPLSLLVFLSSMILGPLGLSPTLEIDNKVFETRKPPLDVFRMIFMTYPYFYAYKAIFTGKIGELFGYATLPKDLKKTPTLYLYGTEKRIQFHDYGALAYLEREGKENRSKSNAIAVENAGHFLYLHQTDVCMRHVLNFMAK
jgi:pimeloyl-ACP methyl ester carboxylesterase